MEVKHRDINEFLYRDEKDIIRSIVYGLTQVKKHLVFSGFTLDTPNYEEYAADKIGLFAVTESEWLRTLLHPTHGAAEPFSYSYDKENGLPAVGAYDARRLNEIQHRYYETADGLSIAKACVRLVLWDK